MHSYLLILVMAMTTILIRFLPFVIFKEKTPDFVMYLGKHLPYCAMAMLVVFCLKDISLRSISSFVPELIAILTTIALQKWKHNTTLSIVATTLIYMFLVQKIF